MAKCKKKRITFADFLYRTLAVVTAVVTAFALLSTVLLIAEWRIEESARTLPPYPKQDITSLLEQDSWSEEDYRTLYLQTGLGKAPLDQLKGNTQEILAFQDALFYDARLAHIYAAPSTPHEVTVAFTAPIAPLEDGDVFVTSSCHTYGWRNGHAALVTSGSMQLLLQSVAPGTISRTESPYWFSGSSNFIILRLKDTPLEERAQIARNAERTLVGLPYSLTVGLFSPKDQGKNITQTHCSHLVWQAYKTCGYDIDSNGGWLVTSKDIANCPLFEVVQVYGFDPNVLWK